MDKDKWVERLSDVAKKSARYHCRYEGSRIWEDLAQDIVAKLLDLPERFPNLNESQLVAYARTVALNVARDYYKLKSSHEAKYRVLAQETEVKQSVPDDVNTQEITGKIRAALAPKDLEVFDLLMQDYSAADIARLWGVSRTTIFYAVARIRSVASLYVDRPNERPEENESEDANEDHEDDEESRPVERAVEV